MGLKELESLVDKVNEKYGQELMISPKKGGAVSMPRFSSGSIELDVALGGGWPRGKIIEIFGQESCGKTFLVNKAFESITNSKANNQAMLIDEEGSFDEDWASKCGIDQKNVHLFRSQYAEQALDVMELSIQSGELDVVALDSIAALVPKEEQEASVEKQQYALAARLVGKAIRKVYSALRQANVKDKLPSLFLINQIRIKVGVVFGNPETTPAGNAIKFASSVRVDIRKDEMVKDDESEVYAQTSKFTVIKNKTAPPLKKGTVTFFIDGPKAGQFDNYRGLLNLLVKFELIEKAKGWYRSALFEKPINGEKAVILFFEQLYKDKKLKVLNGLVEEVEKKALRGNKIEFRFK